MAKIANRYTVDCEECGDVATHRDAGRANRAAGDHFADTGHVATVTDTKTDRDLGLASVCVDCSFFYHHGAVFADEKRADDHRRHGGDKLADTLGEPTERHAVALVDIANGRVVTSATDGKQHPDGAAMSKVGELRTGAGIMGAGE